MAGCQYFPVDYWHRNLRVAIGNHCPPNQDWPLTIGWRFPSRHWLRIVVPARFLNRRPLVVHWLGIAHRSNYSLRHLHFPTRGNQQNCCRLLGATEHPLGPRLVLPSPIPLIRVQLTASPRIAHRPVRIHRYPIQNSIFVLCRSRRRMVPGCQTLVDLDCRGWVAAVRCPTDPVDWIVVDRPLHVSQRR